MLKFACSCACCYNTQKESYSKNNQQATKKTKQKNTKVHVQRRGKTSAQQKVDVPPSETDCDTSTRRSKDASAGQILGAGVSTAGVTRSCAAQIKQDQRSASCPQDKSWDPACQLWASPPGVAGDAQRSLLWPWKETSRAEPQLRLASSTSSSELSSSSARADQTRITPQHKMPMMKPTATDESESIASA